MSKKAKKYSFKWKRLLKILGFSFLGLFLIANLLVLITGKLYLYKAVGSTYFRGQTGPGIYDSTLFFNRMVSNAETQLWGYDSTGFHLTENEIALLEEGQTTSFLVVKGDQILFEKYFENHNDSLRSNSFSMAKSIISLLVGCAIDDGHIMSIDQKVAAFLPEFDDEKLRDISLRHLLNMSAGLYWDESSSAFSDNAEAYYGWSLRSMIKEMTVEEPPGEIFDYKSGYTQVLGFVLEKVTGKKVAEYASEKIWSKIGAEHPAFWSLDNEDGMEKSFCCFYSTTRDFARIGKLVNNYGRWNGQKIVSSQYIREMITPATELTRRNGMPNNIYGLFWWVVQGEGEQVFYARGILGQYIICFPARQLVVVRTGHVRGDVPREAIMDPNNPEQRKVEHPADLFYYINIGKRMDRGFNAK